MADGSNTGTNSPDIVLELFSTHTSITAKVYISAFDPTINYAVVVSYYRAGYPNDKVNEIFNIQRPMTSTMDFDHTFTGLMPDTMYAVVVDLRNTSGTPSTPSGSIRASKTVMIHTKSVTGSFASTNTGASVVATEFSVSQTLDIETKVRLSHKKSDSSTWAVDNTTVFNANSTIRKTYIFTGLMSDTSYDFRAELLMGDIVFRTYDITIVTKYYDPTWSEVLPVMEEFLAVPNTGKAYIRARFSQAPNWEEGEVGLHLFRYDGYDYVERFEFLDIFSDDIIGIVSETAGTQMSYKLGLISSHSSSDVFNMTEPFTISYPQYTWADKVAGQPLIVSAEDVWNMADSLIRAHEYQVAVVKYHEYDYDHERRQSALDSLKGLMSGIRVGGEITADIINAVDLLAITFLETDSTAIDSRLNAIKEAQGEVIDAVDINDMKSLVTNALATI